MNNNRVRNQRVSTTRQRKQQHLLEVTVRRDVAVSQRNRSILAFSLRFLLIIALGAGTYFGGKTVFRRFIWDNPDYFLSDLRISTDGVLTREQIISAGEIELGRNIFKINMTKTRDGLVRLPQAEHVDVQRVLPNRLNISITERRPIAWVCAKAESSPANSEKAFLIDSYGFVMRSKTALPEYLHMPVITGVEMGNLVAGQRVRSLEMQAALELVRLNADSTRFQVRFIDISKGYCLKVTSRTHSEVTFGLDRVDLQLERLNRLLDHLEPAHREIQTVNLLVERNMPVTFFDPAMTSAEPDEDSVVTPEVPKSSGTKPTISKTSSVKTPSASSKKEAASSAKGKKDPASSGSRKIETSPSARPQNSSDPIRKPFHANG